MSDSIETKLGTLRYNSDKEAHILVNFEKCKECESKPCRLACPAQCFKLINGQFQFQYEDCIECGTCKIICNKNAIQWNYPRGTFGIAFRMG
jgi:ferredoxin like protein